MTPASAPDSPVAAVRDGVGARIAATGTVSRTPELPRLGPRSTVILLLVTVVGAIGFGWPFLASGSSSTAPDAGHVSDAPWLLAIIALLVLLAVVAALLDGVADAKALALLGVLAAVAAALRPFGAGVAGLEPMFVVLILGGRVLGPVLGFTLGSTAMFASALLTAGVGPWLPFQMLAASWIGAGAGLLPGRLGMRGRVEVGVLAAYAVVTGFAYGAVMNLWSWPLMVGSSIPFGYDPSAGVSENLRRYGLFYVASSLGWDLPRGIINATLVVLAGPRLLAALRRAVTKAAFGAPMRFEPVTSPQNSVVDLTEGR